MTLQSSWGKNRLWQNIPIFLAKIILQQPVNADTLFVRTVSHRGRTGGLQASSNCWIKGQNYGDSNGYKNYSFKNTSF